MARVPLFRGGELDGPKICAQCGKRVVMGVMLSVKIGGDEQFRVCSFECEKALKEKHANSDSSPAHA